MSCPCACRMFLDNQLYQFIKIFSIYKRTKTYPLKTNYEIDVPVPKHQTDSDRVSNACYVWWENVIVCWFIYWKFLFFKSFLFNHFLFVIAYICAKRFTLVALYFHFACNILQGVNNCINKKLFKSFNYTNTGSWIMQKPEKTLSSTFES